MIETVRRVYESYGFLPLETPALEYVETLGKFLPEGNTPEGGIFAFRDEDAEWVALRYDLTAPLARVVAQYPELPRPFRRYQVGPVWRLEKPGPGWVHHFEKVGQRKALAIALASLAAMIRVSREGLVQEARLAWGSVAPTVAASEALESALVGMPLEESALAGVFPLIQEALSPIDDVRASAAYRRAVSERLVLRLCQVAKGSEACPAPPPREGP